MNVFIYRVGGNSKEELRICQALFSVFRLRRGGCFGAELEGKDSAALPHASKGRGRGRSRYVTHSSPFYFFFFFYLA
jgi:hypothetical protein